MSDAPPLLALRDVVEAYDKRAREELQARLAKWPVDLAQNEVHEVLGGLLARQVTLATELVGCPPLWTEHVAPLLLRAMADLHITLAWLIQDAPDRCRKFIYYGLGQEKLFLEHRRAAIKERPPTDEERAHLAAAEDWINHQRAAFLTDVNLGQWSGVSTRDMAEQAGCLDFYNLVYAPFSACTHSMWQHIARHNLRQCRNPLHRYHYVPAACDAPLDSRYAYLAGKYLQKSLSTFDNAVGTSYDRQSAFDLLVERLDHLESGDLKRRTSLLERLQRWWARATS